MKRSNTTVSTLIRIWKRCLAEGRTIEIDGLGAFVPRERELEFVPDAQPRIFIAYAEEDLVQARRLYDEFTHLGFNPWLDREKLLPGQNWPRSIEQAIGISDFFVPCFSRRAAAKRGTFNSELRYALDCAANLPLDEIYIIPVRLEPCRVPPRITREIQYVDLFPDWNAGIRRIARSIQKQMRARLKLAG